MESCSPGGGQQSAHLLAHPVPCDFTQGWSSCWEMGEHDGAGGGVCPCSAGPSAGWSSVRSSQIPGLPGRRSAQAECQRSFTGGSERRAGLRGLEAPGRLGRKGLERPCPLGWCPQCWEYVIVTSKGDCKQPRGNSPLKCVWIFTRKGIGYYQAVCTHGGLGTSLWLIHKLTQILRLFVAYQAYAVHLL